MPRRSKSRHSRERSKSRRSRTSLDKVRMARPPGVDPVFWNATQNEKHFGNYAAFTAPRDARGRVMVVKNRRTNEWMLPGGLANLGEHSYETAARETLEEAGVRPVSMRKVHNRGSVALFDAPGTVSRSKQKRQSQFRNRKDRQETSDYGFVNLGSPTFHVTSYDGTPKQQTGFRKGTVRHLRSLQ